MLLVVLARPELRELREALVSGRRASDVIELDPLGAAESRMLVDELLGRADLPEHLAARVLRATEGNPLFVGETVRMLVDEGVLRRKGDTWVAAEELVDVEMPPTIHALLAARLERLGDDERAMLERTSVVGAVLPRGGRPSMLRYPVELEARLESLRRKEWVEPDGGYFLGEPALRFHHVLIRDAAYRRLLRRTRAELHERLADWADRDGRRCARARRAARRHLRAGARAPKGLGPLDPHGPLGAARARLARHGRPRARARRPRAGQRPAGSRARLPESDDRRARICSRLVRGAAQRG